jgi:hypothetical protein
MGLRNVRVVGFVIWSVDCVEDVWLLRELVARRFALKYFESLFLRDYRVLLK